MLDAGAPYTADLGRGVAIEFVWIEALGGWASRFEITNAQYRRYQPEHVSGTYARFSLGGRDQPVVNVPYEDGFAVTAPVRRSGENSWGLFGVGGNAWEWTHEPGQSFGRARGGSWLDRGEDFLRWDGGYSLPLRYRFEGLGFRLVLMPDGEEQP